MPDLTLSTRELLVARQGLMAIGEKAFKNIKAAYALAKVKRAAAGALEDLEVARKALCMKHAMQVNGQPVMLPDGTYDFGGNQSVFEAEWTQLLTEPVTLPGCRAITLDELDGTEGITADQLFSLGPLVVTGGPD